MMRKRNGLHWNCSENDLKKKVRKEGVPEEAQPRSTTKKFTDFFWIIIFSSYFVIVYYDNRKTIGFDEEM